MTVPTPPSPRLPADEQLAMLIARAREQMIGQVRQVYTNTLDEIIRNNLLPMSPDSKEAQALAIAVAAAAVTAAQLMSDRTAAGLVQRFAQLEERLRVLESAGAEVKGLADQLTDALARLGTPTREEFERISREVFGRNLVGPEARAELAAAAATTVVLSEGSRQIAARVSESYAASPPATARRLVVLEPNEVAPFAVIPPPIGTRWETDEELRARLKARLTESFAENPRLTKLTITCDHAGIDNGQGYMCPECAPPRDLAQMGTDGLLQVYEEAWQSSPDLAHFYERLRVAGWTLADQSGPLKCTWWRTKP